MRAQIIAPVGEPILRLGFGIADPLESQPTGDRSHGGLAQVARVQSLQVRYKVLNLGGGKQFGRVNGHERLFLLANLSESLLVERVKLTGDVHDLERVSVLVAGQASDFATVPSPGNHGR